ncbi:patatin-like phospholipase family protein [Amycolatopsis rhabdoformis]|uniref:Patatin-like phospholipase family protein n=1 Tax=Amycolatopsis rhabdoformis TaxID=1448059 RepID=A0ABZ1I938_9PSEU|nr:patatin-like phospholipase family protein [Amycolatopsis rhabdoformis]WSE29935.1 patatin-like phospholipase family protein [Amycolatopsis rhabdoformis]
MNQDQRSAKALVLGGGGPVGASWESALLHRLGTAGFTVSENDVVLGTSAGSVAGAWLIMSPDELIALPERMRARAKWHAEQSAHRGTGSASMLSLMAEKRTDDVDSARSVGQAALKAIPPIPAEKAAELWRAATPKGLWPPNLRIAAVDAGTGLAHAWSVGDDIPLPVAIAASTAAPGAAPPVEVAGAVWVDGGVRSGTNADLVLEAAGRTSGGKVLIVACSPSDDIAREESLLTEQGYDVRVLLSEAYYRKPTDLLDARFIDAAVEAGARQARDAAVDLVKWWTED